MISFKKSWLSLQRLFLNIALASFLWGTKLTREAGECRGRTWQQQQGTATESAAREGTGTVAVQVPSALSLSQFFFLQTAPLSIFIFFKKKKDLAKNPRSGKFRPKSEISDQIFRFRPKRFEFWNEYFKGGYSAWSVDWTKIIWRIRQNRNES